MGKPIKLEVQADASKAVEELKNIGKQAKKTASQADDSNKKINESNKKISFKPISEGLKKIINSFKRTSKQAQNTSVDLNKAAKKMKESLDQTGETKLFKWLKGGAIAAGLTLGLNAAKRALQQFGGMFYEHVVKPSADFEQTMNRVSGFFGGDSKAAQSHVMQVRDYAVATGQNADDLSAANQSLLAFGVDPQKSLELMSQMSDLALQFNTNIADLASIYGIVRQAEGGVFTNERVQQLEERGIAVRSVLADRYGVSQGEIKERGSKGQLTIEDLEYVLKKLTSEGEEAHGAGERNAKTFYGMLESVKTEFENLALMVGKEVIPVFSNLVKGFSEFLDQNKGEVMGALVDFAKLLGGLIETMAEFGLFLYRNKEALWILAGIIAACLAPFSAVAAVVAAVIAALTGLYMYIKSKFGGDTSKEQTTLDKAKQAAAKGEKAAAEGAQGIDPEAPKKRTIEGERPKTAEEIAEEERRKRGDEFGERLRDERRKAYIAETAGYNLFERKLALQNYANKQGIGIRTGASTAETLSNLENQRIQKGLAGQDVSIIEEFITEFEKLKEAEKRLSLSNSERSLNLQRNRFIADGDEAALEALESTENLRASYEKYRSLGDSEREAKRKAEEDERSRLAAKQTERDLGDVTHVKSSRVEVGAGGFQMRIGQENATLTIAKNQLAISEQTKEIIAAIYAKMGQSWVASIPVVQ